MEASIDPAAAAFYFFHDARGNPSRAPTQNQALTIPTSSVELCITILAAAAGISTLSRSLLELLQ